ncbi:MAG: insulinase family protein [Candidatus Omnitrophica bacterium]|nr:insulinase family protein [Candidatus Omnitrophota bacterium]
MTAFAVHQFTLENGLSVAWEEDHRQPLVAIEVRILGGLRGEGQFLGTGVTHFLEHMLFKGTTSRAPGTIEQEVRSYGGTINAFTSHDFTGVNLFVESRYLDKALGMLADILQHAVFPQEEFDKERAVVLSELHMNRDDPDRRLNDLFWSRQFLVHPYRHPILGYQPLLERLTVQDMRALYQAQYVPNNVVLTCVGGLDPKSFPDLVKTTFGSWPLAKPYQVAIPEEPRAISVKEVREALPVQAAYAMFGFPSVRLGHPDLYALDVLSAIAGQGRSSRLYEELVRTRKLAYAVGTANYTPFDPGAFTVYLRTDPGQLSAAMDGALGVLETIAKQGITAEELRKAQRQVVAEYVFRHQTVESKAGDLASSFALTGDPSFSRRYVEEIEQVRAEDVKRVAGQYLDRGRMTVAVIQPQGMEDGQANPSEVAQISVTKTPLANGLTLLRGINRQLPMATIVLAARGGVRIERDATQGLSSLVAQLLTKGTTSHTANQIAESIESLGGVLEPFSGRDGFGLLVQVLAEDLDKGLGLLQELVTQSTFPEEELALQRQLILKDLDARDDDVFDVAGRLLRKTLFTSHPYRFDPTGTRESVAALTRANCVAFAKERLVPSNLVLAVFGDVDEAKVLQQAQERFGGLPAGQAPWPQTIDAEPLQEVRKASMTMPKEQTVIFLGFRGTRMNADDRYPLELLTAILSGMSGRLFQAVREQQGLAYTLGAFQVAGWDPGYLVIYAATRPAEREQVLKTIREQLQLVLERGVTEEELAQAKQYLVGLHRMDLQELAGMAKRSALDELYGLGYNAWEEYEAKIGAVSVADVRKAAERYVTPSRSVEVIVGPAAVAAPSPNPPKPVPAGHGVR